MYAIRSYYDTEKRSFPQADEDKLAGIEEGATVGADWDTNVSNKPTTISAEQATAIEANTAKRSYPEADENKLAGIEESATVGADWETNVQNKPTTIVITSYSIHYTKLYDPCPWYRFQTSSELTW